MVFRKKLVVGLKVGLTVVVVVEVLGLKANLDSRPGFRLLRFNDE